MMELPDGTKLIMLSGVHRIQACDRRQTDRQASCHGTVRAMHTRRAVIKRLRLTCTKVIDVSDVDQLG